ncbi:MAG: ferritin-like domain-containing protein [Synechococcales bacterium]|nr:ferritin-like domain-containing protein [Synechococcales bacterium]
MMRNSQPSRNLSRSAVSRRNLLVTLGATAGLAATSGVSTGMTLLTERAEAAAPNTKQSDIKILNNALYYEHQAIWAYDFAAGKLSNTEVGKAVLAIALMNQRDHKAHRDALAAAVRSLGGKPVMAEKSYDVSSYLNKGEGGLDSDANIAKLALALEVDAAIAYTQEVAQLKTPALITAGATIGSNEASHATAIRAAFKSLGVGLDIVPSSFVSADLRDRWILKV